jgi:hypothetical protein
VYLGSSPYHAQTVALILNLSTGHVSPQYHVVYGDDFTTVGSLKLGTVPTNWSELCESSRDLVTDVPFQLSPDWTQPSSTQPTIDWLTHALDSSPSNTAAVFGAADASVPSHEVSVGNATPSEGDEEGDSMGRFTPSEGADERACSSDIAHLDPISGEAVSPIHQFMVEPDSSLQMPPSINFSEAGLRRSTRKRKPTTRLIESPIFGLVAARHKKFQRFNLRRTLLRTMSFAALQIHHQDSVQNLDDGTSNSMHPLAFSAILADNEVFHYGHAMKQPDPALFITAMVKEVEDLTKAGVWKLHRKSEIGTSNLVNAIWSFKRKRAPDGTIIKHKARLCAHGGIQIEGEHFWEMYSPVDQMTTVRLLLTLSLLLNLKSRSIDFTLAFTQAPIDVETYI